MGNRGFEDLEHLQHYQLGKVKEAYLCCGQGGILEVTGRTGIVGVEAVFGMEKIDGSGEKEEDKEKNDIELFFISLGHRIPRGIHIMEKRIECQILSMIGARFKTGSRILRRRKNLGFRTL